MSIPAFSDYGKGLDKDLLGGFCFQSSLLIKDRQPDLTFTLGLKGKLANFYELEYTGLRGLETTCKYRVDGLMDANVKVKDITTGLDSSLQTSVDPNSNDPKQQAGVSVLKATYHHKLFTAEGGVTAHGASPTYLNLAASLGSSEAKDAVTLGFDLVYDLRQDKEDVKDFNLGVQYRNGPFTGTLRSYDNGEKVALGWVNKISQTLSIGAKFESSVEADNVGTFGINTQLESGIQLKAKMSNLGVLTMSLERELAVPKALVCFTSEYHPFKSFLPSNYGLKVTLGDF
eukprot:g63264.t1